MKIRFYCCKHAYTVPVVEKEIDTLDAFGLTEDEWLDLTEEHRRKFVEVWMLPKLVYGWERADAEPTQVKIRKPCCK